MADTALALSLAGVTKSFGTLRALASVDLAVQRGSVHALLGENGAGKTTLMRVASGLMVADAGRVALFGNPVARLDSRTARAAGVAMVQQHHSLALNLTAAENVAVGGRGSFSPRRAQDSLRRLMASSGLHVVPDVPVRELSIVERQRLEILKALSRSARLLILDEPTPGLAPAEIEDLLGWVRSFARSGGSVVLVTHKLREARQVADEVTVLRRGQVVLRGAAGDVSDADIAAAMFPEGHALSPRPLAMPAFEDGAVVASAARVSISDDAGVPRIQGANLELRRGEIVGVAAVEGSGHRLLLEALAGIRSPNAGTLVLPPRIAAIPADRLRDALIPSFSLVENLALRGAGARRGTVPWKHLASRTEALVHRFGIAAGSTAVAAGTLSGGNQQRLVIARELEDQVDMVVADNPTRGLDLQAVSFVHQQLRLAAAQGAVVIVHSSDLDELFDLAHRMVVVFHGDVRAVPFDRDAVGRAMIGA